MCEWVKRMTALFGSKHMGDQMIVVCITDLFFVFFCVLLLFV